MADGNRRVERLRQEAKELVGRRLPEVELLSYIRVAVQLHLHLAKPIVIYLYPGTATSPFDGKQSPLADAQQHRGFSEHREELVKLGYRMVGISSQHHMEQAAVLQQDNFKLPDHDLWSDPKRALARELDVPTFRSGATFAYHRITLIAEEAVIVKTFVPDIPAHSAAQVLAWARMN